MMLPLAVQRLSLIFVRGSSSIIARELVPFHSCRCHAVLFLIVARANFFRTMPAFPQMQEQAAVAFYS